MKKVKFVRFQSFRKKEDSSSGDGVLEKLSKSFGNIYDYKETENIINEFLAKDGAEIKVLDVKFELLQANYPLVMIYYEEL